ncbi:hypothetical protein GMDG_06236 [Pseudogymnoascus destructans 20631-21]|uniref:Uncharacterized protein n=1 Tax=Pseudogymnoascus destructans (strain ATCC MYA-4855 / 20631-21) TaxID=658429 RepID=L8FRV4_PSED2|nr:hypothetical protein GMDG_06236 [Pseudogymnoascus destructans 20631-21]
MPIPTPSGALSAAFRVLCLCCLRAKARGIQSHECVWSAASYKCGYCTVQHLACVPLPWFLGEEFEALHTAEEATPLVPADVATAATEANQVALLAAQTMPKFRSEVERDLYEEACTTRAALESGLAMTNSVVTALSADGTGERPGSLGGVGGCCGKLPTTAAPVVTPTRGDGRKEGEDGKVGAAYGA